MDGNKKNRDMRLISIPEGHPQSPAQLGLISFEENIFVLIWAASSRGSPSEGKRSHSFPVREQAQDLPESLVGQQIARIFYSRLADTFSGSIAGHGSSSHVYGSWCDFSWDSCYVKYQRRWWQSCPLLYLFVELMQRCCRLWQIHPPQSEGNRHD